MVDGSKREARAQRKNNRFGEIISGSYAKKNVEDIYLHHHFHPTATADGISQCLLKYIFNGRKNQKRKDHGDGKLGSTEGWRGFASGSDENDIVVIGGGPGGYSILQHHINADWLQHSYPSWAERCQSANSAESVELVKEAWELLKGRPHNVDLILTEVDLPSIYIWLIGYALLTLIMEHEICKNIPVEVDKPAASRSESAEIYVWGLGYKAPAKIDSRLLDVKHLFQGSVEPQPKVVDVLRDTKQKRHHDE
ncbi:hypothetical protein JHK82_012181 [Glycine max]|nr:hypothetical protein JHK82_012181 [Glycine max]